MQQEAFNQRVVSALARARALNTKLAKMLKATQSESVEELAPKQTEELPRVNPTDEAQKSKVSKGNKGSQKDEVKPNANIVKVKVVSASGNAEG